MEEAGTEGKPGDSRDGRSLAPETVWCHEIARRCDFFPSRLDASGSGPFWDAAAEDYRGIFDGSAVHVTSRDIHGFFQEIFPSLTSRIILVTGNEDWGVPREIWSVPAAPETSRPPLRLHYLDVLNDDRIIHWHTQNRDLRDHPKLSPIPIGCDFHTLSENLQPGGRHPWGPHEDAIAQEASLRSIRDSAPAFSRKPPVAYGNFHFTFDKSGERQSAFRILSRNSGAVFQPSRVPRKESWTSQARYAFAVCPHGNGLDCHRTWEALALNCVPIVKSSTLDPLYQGLPVVIVHSWEEVTPDRLIQWQQQHANAFQEDDRRKLTSAYWIERIRNQGSIPLEASS